MRAIADDIYVISETLTDRNIARKVLDNVFHMIIHESLAAVTVNGLPIAIPKFWWYMSVQTSDFRSCFPR